MSKYRFRYAINQMLGKRLIVWSAGSLLLFSSCATTPINQPSSKDIFRIALFNIWEMSTEKLTNIDSQGLGQ